MIHQDYPTHKPSQLAKTTDNRVVEIISYPYEDKEKDLLLIRVRMVPGDPTSMVEIDVLSIYPMDFKTKFQYIKCAAIRKTFIGKRHDLIINANRDKERIFISNGLELVEQGFLTGDNEFVNRERAAEIAFEAGQIKEQIDTLMSQDLIEQDEWYYKDIPE